MEDRKKIVRQWLKLREKKLSKSKRLESLSVDHNLTRKRLTEILQDEGVWYDSQKRQDKETEEKLKREERLAEREREEERLEEIRNTPLIPLGWKILFLTVAVLYIGYCTIRANDKADFEACLERGRNTTGNFGHCVD